MKQARAQRQIMIGVVVILLLVGPVWTTFATSGGQAALPIRFMEYQQGRLDDATPQQLYSIDLRKGMIFSISMFMRTGDVLPQVTVFDPDGMVMAVGVPPFVGADSSIVNAEIAPEDGIYQVMVERAAGTGGDYLLITQPGYEYLHVWENFETYDVRLSLEWLPSNTPDSMATVNTGEMVLHVFSPETTSFISPEHPPTFANYYVEVDVEIANSPSYYDYGLALHKSLDATQFYALFFSSEGDWSLMFYDGMAGAWNVIQDWTVSPLIEATTGETVNVGVWVQGGTFNVYYNHELLGTVVDPFPRTVDGTIALIGSSGSDVPSNVELHYDNIVITSPKPPPPQ